MDSAKYVIFFGRRPFIAVSRDSSGFGKHLRFEQLKRLSHSDVSSIDATSLDSLSLLNICDDGTACFAVTVPDDDAVVEDVQLRFQGKFVDPRYAFFLLSAGDAGLMSKAHSLLEWSGGTQYCCSCGAELRSRTAGLSKLCPGCERVHYASPAPVGITMVTNAAHTRALLVRQPRHPPLMFSCVAGFLEPGESVETCVRREVAEEVGLEVTEVTYCSSLHWPFQRGSCMLGCLAVTEQTQLDVDPEEIEEARWFSVEEVEEAFQRTVRHASRPSTRGSVDGPWVPPDGTTAHLLIKHWLDTRAS